VLLFVEIDLTAANLELFDAYERQVLGLLGKYGARLENRFRLADHSREFHVLRFPDAEAREAYRSDPVRLAAQEIWLRCGASATSHEVLAVA
jgi:hypothetical protein